MFSLVIVTPFSKRYTKALLDYNAWNYAKGYDKEIDSRKKEVDAPHQQNYRLLADLAAIMKVGGRRFIRFLEKGFPSTGVYDEPGINPRRVGGNKKEPHGLRNWDDLAKLTRDNLEDINRIASSQDAEETQFIFDRLMTDVDDGFLLGPYKLSDIPPELKEFWASRAFTRISSDKRRLIINALRSKINTLAEVRTPIGHTSVKTIKEICRSVHWPESAFKNVAETTENQVNYECYMVP